MPMFRLDGKTALVTGSTQGIGLGIAKAFVESGAKVIVHCSKDLVKAERIKSEIGAYRAVVGDLSSSDEVRGLYEKTGGVDILVTNASLQLPMPWEEVGEAELDRQIAVNFKSTYLLMQLYTPYMKEQKFGRIITIGSVQQRKPHEKMTVYAATKCAVMSLVSSVAPKLAPYGITVNNIAPGAINTPRNALSLSDENYKKQVEAKIPAGRIGDVKDVAGAAVLLASNEGSYIVGADIPVDGGMGI